MCEKCSEIESCDCGYVETCFTYRCYKILRKMEKNAGKMKKPKKIKILMEPHENKCNYIMAKLDNLEYTNYDVFDNEYIVIDISIESYKIFKDNCSMFYKLCKSCDIIS